MPTRRKPTRRPRVRRKTQSRKKPLTKKAVKQTRKIAKSVVLNMAESKYFNTNPSLDQTQAASAWVNSGVQSEVGVFGYTTGLNRARIDNGTTITQTIYKYGVNTLTGAEVEMKSLDLNKVFNENNSSPQRANMSVEGATIRPNYNECQWLLNRVQGNVTANSDNGLVYKVRMIRVVPRAKKGTYLSIDPKMDLFLDQYNEPFGINTTNVAGQNVFTQFECLLAKVNSRRYKVLADKFITLMPANKAIMSGVFTVNEVYDGLKKFKTKHNIGKEFFYEDPNNTDAAEFGQYPDTGFQNEFVLFHVIAVGHPETSADSRLTPGLLNITARPVSTFKDM